MLRRRLRLLVDMLASVRLAIPLLVLIAIASVAGSLIPQGSNVKLDATLPDWVHGLNQYLQLNDIYHSWWFVLLVAVLGVSLLAITVKRVPALWRKRGLVAGTGVLMAHLGVLLVLAGVTYGSLSGVRYHLRLIEGEVTVTPSLPFVIKLDRLDIDYYAQEDFRHRGPDVRRVRKQDSVLTLFHHGTEFLQAAAAPGRPVSARGFTLLPVERERGWVFDLVLEAGGREKVVPIRPWAPPLITLGMGSSTRVLTHRLMGPGPGLAETTDALSAEILVLEEGGSVRSLGFASESEHLTYGPWTISVGGIRAYTGLQAYTRPEQPFLVSGILVLLVGLTGYFTRWGLHLLPSRTRMIAR